MAAAFAKAKLESERYTGVPPYDLPLFTLRFYLTRHLRLTFKSACKYSFAVCMSKAKLEPRIISMLFCIEDKQAEETHGKLNKNAVTESALVTNL